MRGQAVVLPDFMVPLERNGYVEECYFDFSYNPIKDEHGSIGGILVICMEITEKVLAINKFQRLNEELAAFNEELTKTQGDLQRANSELSVSQSGLKKAFEAMTRSEKFFRSI